MVAQLSLTYKIETKKILERKTKRKLMNIRNLKK